MPMSRRWGIMLGLLCYLAAMLIWGSNGTQAQDATLDDEIAFEQAAQAVVRILACYADRCEIGSGVVIDPNGIILTAWHVVARDPTNLDSAFYQNLEIQMSDDVANPPETRYRAQVIAAKPDQDLALLRITYDVQSGRNVTLGFGLDLPWLPLSAQTPRTAQLRIMGFPPVSDTLSYPTFAQSGLEEGGALLKVQNPLSRGFSGGPALLRQADGPFEIVGLVIKRRGEEVSLIRNIHQLQGLKWQIGAQRAWAEAIEVRYDAQTLQVRLDLHALDLAGRQVQARVLFLDAATNQPWSPASTNLPTTDRGQVFLDRTVAIGRFAEVQRAVTLEAPVAELGVAPERLRFRVSLWDGEGAVNFWQSTQAHVAQPTSEALALASPIATVSTPTETAISTATPDLAATAQALESEVRAAIDATLTALAPTATPTLNFDQLLATAVAATLINQPTATASTTRTPTRTPAPSPTNPPTRTPTPPSQPAIAVINSQLNVRQGPGTEYAIIGQVNEGQRFPITAKNQAGSWWRLDYNGQAGWVAGQYVTAQNASAVEVARDIPPPPIIAEPGAGTTRTVADITFVYVPAGAFTMGSPPGVGGDDERPAHAVTLNGFWISRTPVTNAQFRRFIDAGGYNQSTYWTSTGWQWRTTNNITQPAEWGAKGSQADHPVVGVGWYGAIAYANWLAQQSRQPVRLPSEAEWERAARGNDGRAWPWGNTAPHDGLLNFNNRVGGPSAVGSYPAGASPYGALDMAGNVWELTHSLYWGYPYRANDGREVRDAAGKRVVRGGRWASDADGVRSARRGNTDPDNQDIGHGFRLAISHQ
ncbi:MAG: SUMF1/EgtB/PvdO family nonheme iron enzyme [Caldilineaceae bacterium]|nr:SUMF1/EgtB/PvdO family nonheme iron enzyme [Caldilineaceae bacterium]